MFCDIFFLENIIRDKYLCKIRPYYESDLIKVITGIRRCGKSVILSQIVSEIQTKVDSNHIIKIDLENVEGRIIKTCDKLENKIMNLIKDNGKYHIFIDEIQNIKNFEVVLVAIRVSVDCSFLLLVVIQKGLSRICS